MQEVLVDRDQFVAQRLVEMFDDLGVAFHVGSPCKGARNARDTRDYTARCGNVTE